MSADGTTRERLRALDIGESISETRRDVYGDVTVLREFIAQQVNTWSTKIAHEHKQGEARYECDTGILVSRAGNLVAVVSVTRAA